MQMTSTTLHQLALLLLLLLASPIAIHAVSTTCESEKFPPGKRYGRCTDLPHLGAALHWTYDKTTRSLSLAFVATPAASGGWVSWAINPTGDGMKGAQALLAFRNASSSAYVVNTYNITGYRPLGRASTPIAFPVTDLTADAGSGGKIRLYGKLQLHAGMEVINQIWQVGSSVTGGAPDKHAFDKDNLSAKGKLVIAGGAAEPAPAPVAGGDARASTSPPPSGAKSSAAAKTRMPALVLMLLTLVGFLVIV